MTAARLVVGLVCALPALGGAGALVRRFRHEHAISNALVAALATFGAAAGLASFFLERTVFRFTDWSIEATPTSSTAALLTVLLFAAPLEEATKVVVVWPTMLIRKLEGQGQGVVFAVIAAAGFAAAETAAYLASDALSVVRVLRALAGIPAHLFCAGLWGYALGSRAQRRSRWFLPMWVLAVAVHALYDHIVFGRGPGMLAVALPMLAAMAVVTWSVLADIAPHGPHAHSPFSLPEPPSLTAVRQALRHADRPLVLRWILGGALVNTGAVIVCLAVAVFGARRFGVDLSLADEADMSSNVPLALLGSSVLAAFPIAGFLVARASGAHTVLEPAFAAGLAIAVAVVLLSVSAPTAVIFALALSPVAFGLSCGGAWLGMDH